MIATTVPVPHPWDEQIGPFYDTAGVVRLLGISKQAVSDRARRHSIISATTRQGRIVYPAFQFEGRHVVPAISAVAQLFSGVEIDGWALASWFTTPSAALSASTPARWLLRGRDPEPVHALAADAVARWSMP